MTCLGYLCKASANTYGIDFIYFKIRDIDSGRVVFEVRKPTLSPQAEAELIAALAVSDDDSWRCIRYEFPKEFLSYTTVGTTYMPYIVVNLHNKIGIQSWPC